MVPVISFKIHNRSPCSLRLLLTWWVVIGADVPAYLCMVPKQVFSVRAEKVIRLRRCIDSSIASLAEALTIFEEPVAYLRSSLTTDSGLDYIRIPIEVFRTAIHGFQISWYFSELISKLIGLYLQAAGIGTRHRDRCFEVSLLMNTLHHCSRL